MVNGTASFIGPSITLIWAPGGSEGTFAHFRSDRHHHLVGAAEMLRQRGGAENAQSCGNGKTFMGRSLGFLHTRMQESPRSGFEIALIFA